MKWCLCAPLASILALTVNATARDVVLPAGTLLQCTLNEPNFSTNTVSVGDQVLCHLRSQVEFGQQAFPRGSYLVGHLEAAKDPGHFVGKGYLELRFDRIGVPSGDMPLDAKVISAGKYKVDREGKIDGRGHAKRDVVEWMLPPLWPWKLIMLPARGPRPRLKGESVLTLRLMDDVEIPQLAQTSDHGAKDDGGWHFFGRPQNSSFDDAQASSARPQLAIRGSVGISSNAQVSFAAYDLPSNLVTLPGMPVFILNSGTVLAVSGYGYQDNRLTYTLVSGGGGVINTDDVNWAATTRVNAKRGIRLSLHAGQMNVPNSGL
jgi:hypothetical protein